MVELVGDIDGTVFGEAGESISSPVDGVESVIDLKEEHAKELRETVEYYIAYSTRVGGRNHRSGRSVTAVATRRPVGERKKIRAWALEQGHRLSSRGRIPAEIEQAFP